jgi:hypothetical protein
VVAIDWVESRDDALEVRPFFDLELLLFFAGGCAKTKKEQSEERR